MAEGGGEFGYEDPDLDNRVDHDDDDNEENEVERTQPFQPGSASTPYQPGAPYQVGEQTEMCTMQHEQSGLPDTSYAETSFGGEEIPLLEPFIHPDDKQTILERAKEKIRRWRPNVKFDKIHPLGPKGGESKIFLSGEKGLQKSFIDKFSTALGLRAEDIIAEDRDTIREQRQRLTEAENQLQQAETLSSQREEEKKEVENLRRKIEQTNAKIDAIQDKEGSNLESEGELRRLKQVNKNYETDLKERQKKTGLAYKKSKKH